MLRRVFATVEVTDFTTKWLSEHCIVSFICDGRCSCTSLKENLPVYQGINDVSLPCFAAAFVPSLKSAIGRAAKSSHLQAGSTFAITSAWAPGKQGSDRSKERREAGSVP